MKKSFNYILIAGGVVAILLLIRKMNKDRKKLTIITDSTDDLAEKKLVKRSKVEAGSPIVQSEDVFIKEREIAEGRPSIEQAKINLSKALEKLKKLPEIKKPQPKKPVVKAAPKYTKGTTQQRKLRAEKKMIGYADNFSVLY